MLAAVGLITYRIFRTAAVALNNKGMNVGMKYSCHPVFTYKVYIYAVILRIQLGDYKPDAKSLKGTPPPTRVPILMCALFH